MSGKKAVYCAGDQVIIRQDYSVPGHPRKVHADGSLCDHAGSVRIGDARERNDMSEANGPAEGMLIGGFAEEARIRQEWSERRWNATPDHLIVNGEPLRVLPPPAITIHADDGTELLRITRDGGCLDVTGDESRWTEAAARFVAEVRRITGGD